MKDFFTSEVLHPTGFAKMQDKDAVRHKIGLILAGADHAYLILADHPLGLYDKDKLHEHQESFRKEVSAIVVQASYVLDNLTQWGVCPEADKNMLDFVIAKAWGNHHALVRLMDEECHVAKLSKGPLKH